MFQSYITLELLTTVKVLIFYKTNLKILRVAQSGRILIPDFGHSLALILKNKCCKKGQRLQFQHNAGKTVDHFTFSVKLSEIFTSKENTLSIIGCLCKMTKVLPCIPYHTQLGQGEYEIRDFC